MVERANEIRAEAVEEDAIDSVFRHWTEVDLAAAADVRVADRHADDAVKPPGQAFKRTPENSAPSVPLPRCREPCGNALHTHQRQFRPMIATIPNSLGSVGVDKQSDDRRQRASAEDSEASL